MTGRVCREFQFDEEGLTLRVESSELPKTLRWCERLINSIMNLCFLHLLRESVFRQSHWAGHCYLPLCREDAYDIGSSLCSNGHHGRNPLYNFTFVHSGYSAWHVVCNITLMDLNKYTYIFYHYTFDHDLFFSLYGRVCPPFTSTYIIVYS